MLGDRLARDVEPRGDLPSGAFAIGDQCEHRSPARLGENLKDIS